MHGPWVALVCLAVLYLYGPHLSSHMAIMHESFALYVRPQQYAEEMRSGFLQPMLLPDAIRGAGFAFPVFYPPFSYMLAALFGMLFSQWMFGLNFTLFLSVLVSSLGAYACGFSLSRRPSIAALVAILSICVTYRFVNTYVRGALAESWGSAWYPVALFGALELLRIGRRGWSMALGLAGALTSHTVVTMYFVLLLGILCIVALACRWSWRRAVSLFVCGLLGLVLAAWYVVPQLAYLPTVWASDPKFMWALPERMIRHTVDFEQLFEATPERWWGNSYEHPNDEMSFKLGFGYSVMLVVACFAFFRFAIMRRRFSRQQLGLAWVLAAIMFICILFLVWTKPFIYGLPRPFAYLQFPWRLLSVMPIFAAALTAICLRALIPRQRLLFDWFALILCAVLVAEVPYFYTVRRLKLDITSESLTPDYARSIGDKGMTELSEYMPLSYPIENAEHFHPEVPQVINAVVTDWKREPGLTACSAKVECGEGGGRITLPVTFYPFWKAETAGAQPIPLETDRGFISMKLPKGSTTVHVQRYYTKPYYIGWILTALGALALVGWSLFEPRIWRLSVPRKAKNRLLGP